MQAQQLWLTGQLPRSMWDLPGSGIEHVSQEEKGATKDEMVG